MTKEEELKQAVVARNAKRKAKSDELPKRINEFLDSTLAKAIAEDEPTVSVVFKRENVSEELWDKLNDYGLKNAMGNYRKNMLDLIVDDVYRPYLSDYSMDIGYLKSNELPIRVSFYINQD